MIFLKLIVFAIAAFGIIADGYESSLYPYYGTKEGNGLFANKYGFWNPLMEFLVWGLPLIWVFVLWVVLETSTEGSAVISFLLVAGAGWKINEALKSRKDMAKRRLEQIRIVEDLEPYIDDAAMLATALSNLDIDTKGGRVRYVWFGWLYSDDPNLTDALNECRQQIAYFIRTGANFPR